MKKNESQNEAKLVEETRKIKDSLRTLNATFQQVAKKISEIQDGNDPERVEALLGIHAGIAPEDVRILGKVAGLFTEADKDVLRSASPETLRLLAHAPDDVQAEAIRCIAAGHPVGAAKIQQIMAYRGWVEKGEEKTAAVARSACMSSFASRTAQIAIRRVEEMADVFLDVTLPSMIDHILLEDDEGEEGFRYLDGYKQAHSDVTAAAKLLLAEFERVFGGPESFAGEIADIDWTLLKRAHQALCRYAGGRFAREGGFALDENVNSMVSLELEEAVSYLATQTRQPFEPLALHSRPPRPLRVLELCAGAGGMAIGLMSAGFSHYAMYEAIGKRCKTLKTNWPAWPVTHRDIRQLTDADLRKYHGIDLLAGGPPGTAFARDRDQGGRDSEGDLFPEMLRAIRIVHPRAFMIETPPGLFLAPHVAYLADICADTTRLGYTTEVTYLNTKDYGLPQDRKRAVIVGIRNDQPGAYVAPKLSENINRSVTDVLGPLVIKYETAPAKRSERTREERDYDDWASVWRSINRTIYLSTIPTNWTEKDPQHLKGLAKKGFDGSSYAEEPTKVGDVKDSHFKPRLTVEVIACAQGLPEGWKFGAKGEGNVDMIAEAFPPVLAKAVGLSIYSALTGVPFDLDAALATPIINHAGIGKTPRNLNRVWSQDVTINDQVSTFIRNTEAMPYERNKKKHKQRIQKLIVEIEPNPKRRTDLKKVIARIVSKRVSEEASSRPLPM